MSHWVCGPSATSIQVMTSASKTESGAVSKATGASAIVQNGGAKQSAGAAAQSLPSHGAAPAAATGVSTGAGAMPTAMVGVVGVVGALAVFL